MPPRKRPVQASVAIPTQQPNASQLVSDFLRYLAAEVGASENTRKAYASDLTFYASWLAEQQKPLREIDLGVVTAYLQVLHERGLAASSMARHLVAIRMFYRFLVLEGLIAESAVEQLSSPKLWQHLPKVLSPEMVNRLLNAPQVEDRYPLRDRAFLALLYATGCRVSEIAQMTLADVHLAEGFCRCLGKGNKERMVHLNPVALAAMEAYIQHERVELLGRRDCDTLFVSRTGRSLTRIQLWRLVKRYALRAGASNQVSPHTLRHSFATHMLAGGAEIRALQELLGHASIATTQVYTHVDHSRLKAVHTQCHPRG